MPSYEVPDLTKYGIYDDFQSIPDISAHLNYRDGFGHLQLGLLYRRLYYWTGTFPDHTIYETRACNGFGTSLSGLVHITPKLFFTFQGVYGKGIAQYINDFSNAGVDLIVNKAYTDGSGLSSMTALHTYGGYGSFQYDWNKKLSSALVFGMTGVTDVDDLYKENYKFRYSQYGALNLFYKINDYCTCGVEFLRGHRRNFVLNSDDPYSGVANRFNIMFSYTF